MPGVHQADRVSRIHDCFAAERLRNHFMLLDSRPDVVIALPGGEDTEELVAQARAAGLQTLSVSMSTRSDGRA